MPGFPINHQLPNLLKLMSIKSMTGINMGRGKVNMLHIYKVIMKQGILSEYFNLPTFFRFLLKFLFFRKVLVFKKSPPSYKWGFQLCSAQNETYLLKKKKMKRSSVQFRGSVVSDSLRLHQPQDTRLPCPSPTPGAYSNACPSSW